MSELIKQLRERIENISTNQFSTHLIIDNLADYDKGVNDGMIVAFEQVISQLEKAN